MQVGFIGLGAMGWPMATNLYRSQLLTCVHNRSHEKAMAFRDFGYANKESTTAADLSEQRNANCNKAQERLVNAEKARRVYEDTGDGERRYFSAEEQDEYKAKVKADVALSLFAPQNSKHRS